MQTEYLKTVPDVTKQLESLIERLSNDLSTPNLTALVKLLDKTEKSAKTNGFEKSSDLCAIEISDIQVRIRNFQTNPPDESWLNDLKKFPERFSSSFPAETELTQKSTLKPPSTQTVGGSKRRIFVIDDDDDIINLLTHEYHEIGFEVDSVKSGKEALDFLLKEENHHDIFLIVLDRMLPDMDGLEILQTFMEKFPGKIPTLILSGLTMENDIITGLQYGAVDYITKPFSVFKLMQKTLNLLKSKAA